MAVLSVLPNPRRNRRNRLLLRNIESMNVRILLTTGMALLLAGCTTTASLSGDPLSKRWVGTNAGKFFAAYGPPISDEESGSATTYVWRGGYSHHRTAAQYKGEGKNRKLVARAHTDYLVCQVKLVVGSDYMIKSIDATTDKPGPDGGPSWCQQTLDAAK